MKKFYLAIILINFITLNINFTLASEHKKIFIEDMENIFFEEYFETFKNIEGGTQEASLIEIELLKTSLKRQKK